MALIQMGNKEIERLELEISVLQQELDQERGLKVKLNALIVSKEKDIAILEDQLRDLEKIKDENMKLKNKKFQEK